MPRIRYTTCARRDLIDIWLELTSINPTAADELYSRLEARVEILKRFPEAGRPRRDIAAAARVLVEHPYLILYRIIPDAVQIVRVLHGARHIDSTLFTKGIE